MRRHLLPSLSLFLLVPSTLAVSLSQFQTIANFPDTCTKAYDSQINGCTASDFSNGNPCSTSCMTGLQSITTLIDSACAGSQADPTTLIGMFFVGKGLTALCPNYLASVAEASSTHSASTTPSAVYIQTSTLVASSAVVIETSTLQASSAVVIETSTLQASSMTTHTSHTSSSTSTPTSTTTPSSAPSTTTSSSISVLPVPVSQSTSTITSTTITAKASTSSSIERPTFVKTAINDGSQTVLTSKADQTASSNPDAFGGGGSPFEISVGVKAVDGASRVALLAVFAGLVWVV